MAWIRNSVGLGLLVLLGAILMQRDSFDPKKVKNQRVVICGASSGIGEEIAYYYSKLGAKVFLAARRWRELERVRRKCKKLGAANAKYVAVDLGTDSGIDALVKEAFKELDGIDVLILVHVKMFWNYWNPANWTFPQSPDEVLEEQFRINAVSYMKLATKFLPKLEKSDGRIGVVSSGAAILPLRGMAPYSGTKAALHGFFNGLRLDLMARKQSKLSITICVLGAIATDLLKNGMESFPDAKENGLPIYPADECAINIVQGLTRRDRFMFYPSFIKIVQFLYLLFPEYMEQYFIL